MRTTALLLVVALVGCGSVETKEEPKPAVVADTPPPAVATTEIPDFGAPKPPVPAAAKAAKEPESTRDALLHAGH